MVARELLRYLEDHPLQERRQLTLCAVGTVGERQSKRARAKKPVGGPFWVAQVK